MDHGRRGRGRGGVLRRQLAGLPARRSRRTGQPNLHLLLASFYRPDRDRYRVVVEADAFPSDLYAVDTHVAWHGLDPRDAVVKLRPRAGEHVLRNDDIANFLAQEGGSVALCLLGGVNYRTGQLLDIAMVTAAAHAVGCVAGWDLANAAGNVPLALHDWGVDFAAWCGYKYLNGGPGAPAGVFIHERRTREQVGAQAPHRLAGWWGVEPGLRFQMAPMFDPAAGAAGWQVSNPPILAMAALHAATALFDEVGIEALRGRSLRMSAFLDHVLGAALREALERP